MAAPSLSPAAGGAAVPLTTSPFWIGSGAGAGLLLHLPGIAERHLALIEREDGWWASPGRGATALNGTPLSAPVLLKEGDRLELAPGAAWRFASGAPARAAAPPPPEPPPEAPLRKRKKRRKRREPGAGRGVGFWLAVAVIATLVGAAGGAAWYAIHRTRAATLSDADAAYFDQLLQEAYDHIERGSTLLEIGAPQAALGEFARGVNVLETSRLRNNPFVKPRIEALEASVASIYQGRNLAVPEAYRKANPKALPLLAISGLRPSLSTAQFAAAFGAVQAGFEQRFGDSIVVTGRDHPEHLALYGPGGAMDLRTRSMTPAEVRFVVDQCRAAGIRVKDFSEDAVLQQQVAAAIQAGLADRAGTGLHLHIDRFANRRDRWTVN